MLDVLGDLFGINNSKDQEQNQNVVYHEFYAYNAESYNPNTEMQYLRARYYKPETANFLTEDSYLGDILKPLTLNRYNYCAGNPVNYKDPSGNVILEALGAIALGAVAGAAVGAVVGAAAEVYKGVKEYQNQDPQDKKDLSTFLKSYDYASAGRNVAYGAASGAATVAGAMVVGAVVSAVASGAVGAVAGATAGKAIGAAAGKAIGTAAGGAIGGGAHGYLTSKADVIAAKSENQDKTLNADEKRYIAGETLIGAVTGLAGGVVFGVGSKILNASGLSSAITGSVSGGVMSAVGSLLHGKKPELSDTLFSAALGGVVAYGAYKVTDYFVGKNAGTNPEETNAKIRANEDPVKENTGNTASKNSNQNNNGGSKNSGKNNANTKNNNTAKNGANAKNNAKSSQTPLEENANAAKNGAETDTCPNSKGGSKTVNPNDIRFSQSSVNGSAEIVESMRNNGWLVIL